VLDTLKSYEDAVASGDNAAATAIIDEMLTAGAQPVTVLTDVIAAAQARLAPDGSAASGPWPRSTQRPQWPSTRRRR